ncbi:hypothetical protein KAR91_67455 [Candidatus Pacearchaeota archaeon]|nr:hypothetical protein [Candidatus Pacearchaeota archaeon]
MESKVLYGTIMGFQTKDAKGGALVVKVEFPLNGVNAAYLVDIKGKNCKMHINPEEGQRGLDYDAGDDNVLDFPEQDGEPEVNPDDEEEMDPNMEDAEIDEDPDAEYLDDDQAEGI